MTEQNPSVEVKEKDVEWSSTIGVTMPAPGVKVYQRVEKITPYLLENGVPLPGITINFNLFDENDGIM